MSQIGRRGEKNMLQTRNVRRPYGQTIGHLQSLALIFESKHFLKIHNPIMLLNESCEEFILMEEIVQTT